MHKNYTNFENQTFLEKKTWKNKFYLLQNVDQIRVRNVSWGNTWFQPHLSKNVFKP